MIRHIGNPSQHDDGRCRFAFDSPWDRARWIFAAHQCGSTLTEVATTLGISYSCAWRLERKGRYILTSNPQPWFLGLDTRIAFILIAHGYSSRDQVYQAVMSEELTDKPTPEQRLTIKYIKQTTIPGLGLMGFKTLRQWLGIENEI